MTEVGFNHAGIEVWYPNAGTELEHQFCESKVGSGENRQCADTVPILNYSNACHMIYVGINFNLGWCGASSETPQTFLA